MQGMGYERGTPCCCLSATVRLCLEAAVFRLTYTVVNYPSSILCGDAQETYCFSKMDIGVILLWSVVGVLYVEGRHLFMSFQERVHETVGICKRVSHMCGL